MRAGGTRRFFSYMLLSGGALFLFLGGRDVVEWRVGQDAAARQFEQSPPARPSPFGAATLAYRASPQLGDLVARLEIPRLGVNLYVVEGDGARQLRLGPGHARGTAMPGAQGNCIIAGHRDTHFRVLRDIRDGDEIVLQTRGGEYAYRVVTTDVVPPWDTKPLRPTRDAELRLVTCYPFYYLGPAPERFIVQARLEAPVADASIDSSRKMN